MPDKIYERLLKGNQQWSKEKLAADPEFFANLTKGQQPEYLWIGCSDSRVPANEITGTKSGEIFVHRNVANLVFQTDTNLLSVLYFAVEVLNIKQIIVCGHYGCGGVLAAMENKDFGFVNAWLGNIKEVYEKHRTELEALTDIEQRGNRLVELNVIEQVHNLAKTAIIQRAWKQHSISIHGWVYGFNNGIITDLNCMVNEVNDLEPIFRYKL